MMEMTVASSFHYRKTAKISPNSLVNHFLIFLINHDCITCSTARFEAGPGQNVNRIRPFRTGQNTPQNVCEIPDS